MRKDQSIHSLLPEQIDILTLLLYIRHIVNGRRLLFLRLGLLAGFLLCDILSIHNLRLLLIIALDILHILRQGNELIVQILKDDKILHLLLEFLILQAAKLDEWTDIIPVFLVILAVNFVHTGQLVRNLLGNVVRNLLNKAIVLQCAS